MADLYLDYFDGGGFCGVKPLYGNQDDMIF